jgi:superfamily II DNA or RNA helicase
VSVDRQPRLDATGVHDVGARLERLIPGAQVHGLLGDQSVTVVAVNWHGDAALTLTYRDSTGRVAEQLVYRDDEARLIVGQPGRSFSFDGDGELFRLVSEARRIGLAHLFDPMLALSTSTLDPLPHQIQAVYGEMLPRLPLRFLLADDPGAGKTIMAGLYIKELMLRGDLERCLVVAPGSLVEQWQDELAEKFGLSFSILTRELVQASLGGDPFRERPLLIARLDQLSRSEELQARLSESEWDLVVVDEAHRMSAHYFGNELQETKRYRLGKLLGGVTRHLLLMTATPHAGKEQDFQLFLALLDADRFEGRLRDGQHGVDSSDVMRRMIKEKLLTFDGKPLFPERRASTVPYALSAEESALYEEVTHYVSEEMNRADQVGGKRGNTVGFALTILQRRLASSPEAIYQSLVRRGKRLRQRLDLERSGNVAAPFVEVSAYDDDDLDDLAAGEREELEEAIVDSASAATTIAELEREIRELTSLEELARQVRNGGRDVKWQQLASLLQDEEQMFDAAGQRRKLIVFTEHRDTLNYLVDRLRTLIGRPDAVVAIHGGVPRTERRRIQELFTQEKEAVILVATDAAGEGINLQRAHLLVNYDLPWNPNRIEQRFGRVHRIGQQEVCHMWNLVAKETREGQVYTRLLEKIEEQRQAYGGQVFDVLGRVFEETPLRELLLEAIRYGDQPAIRARLDQQIDATVGSGLAELVEREALDAHMLGTADVERIRLRMEEAAARRLQPHYIRSFFLEAFGRLGGRAVEREAGRYEITHVPAALRHASRSAIGPPILARYERVTFEREQLRVAGKPLAELLAPGHPLLDVVVAMTVERHGSLLKQGGVLVDENDDSEAARVLLYLEHAVTDGRGQTVSKRFQFVELDAAGQGFGAGFAPYLDYRPATSEEVGLVKPLHKEPWLASGIDARGTDWAIREIAPAHLAEVRERTVERVERTRRAVRKRLLAEVNYWDQRAAVLTEQMQAGKQPRMNPERARARADELHARRVRREEELQREAQLQALPPVVVGGALVIPGGLLAALRGEAGPAPTRETAAVERRAVDAVLAAERSCGRQPEEMPPNNPGYDIRSRTPDGHWLFLEVKGRIAGADEVSVTRTEMLTGRNAPERSVLALVRVALDGGQGDEVRYLREAFVDYEPHFAETRKTFAWAKLWAAAGEPS